MKYLLILMFISPLQVDASEYGKVLALAQRNGLEPDKSVILLILGASHLYDVDPLDLAAIGILETGLGKYNRIEYNSNKTIDVGIFQINTVNRSKCSEFDLNSVKGSTYCAAKLLGQIKRHFQHKDPQWKARYHSKTKSHKRMYFEKMTKVLAQSVE